MSRRKIKTPQSIRNRKLKKYLYGQKMNDKEWQEYCRKEARKERKLKRAMGEQKEDEFIPEKRKWNEEEEHYDEI